MSHNSNNITNNDFPWMESEAQQRRGVALPPQEVVITEGNNMPCVRRHCGNHYSRFSVNMPPINCCKKVKIPGTTSLPKLC